jgi:hypothetical protein
MKTLNIKAFVALLLLSLAMAGLLFLPAWTVNYWQAWVFISVFVGSSLAITLYLMRKVRRSRSFGQFPGRIS